MAFFLVSPCERSLPSMGSKGTAYRLSLDYAVIEIVNQVSSGALNINTVPVAGKNPASASSA